MKQVKIRFTHNGVEYAPGTKVSDELAKEFPQFVKESPIKEVVVETKPVVEAPKKEAPVTKKTTKKVAKK